VEIASAVENYSKYESTSYQAMGKEESHTTRKWVLQRV